MISGSYAFNAPREDSNDGSSADDDNDFNGSPLSAFSNEFVDEKRKGSQRHRHRPPGLRASRRGQEAAYAVNVSAAIAHRQREHFHSQQQPVREEDDGANDIAAVVSLVDSFADQVTPRERVELALHRMAVLPRLSDALYNPTTHQTAEQRYKDATEAVHKLRHYSPWRRLPDGGGGGAGSGASQGISGASPDASTAHHATHLIGAARQASLEAELVDLYSRGASFIDQTQVHQHSFLFSAASAAPTLADVSRSVFSEPSQQRTTPRRRMISAAGEAVLRRPQSQQSREGLSRVSSFGRVPFAEVGGAVTSRSVSLGSCGSFLTVHSGASHDVDLPMVESSYLRDVSAINGGLRQSQDPNASRVHSGFRSHSHNSHQTVPVFDDIATLIHISVRVTVPQLMLYPSLFPQLDEATITLSPQEVGDVLHLEHGGPFTLKDLLDVPTSVLARGLGQGVLEYCVLPMIRRWVPAADAKLLLGEGAEAIVETGPRATRATLGPALPLLQRLLCRSASDVVLAWPTKSAYSKVGIPDPSAAHPGRSGEDIASSGSDADGEAGGVASSAAFLYLSGDAPISAFRELHAWGRQLTAKHLVEGATRFRDVRHSRLPNGSLIAPARDTAEVPLELFLLLREHSEVDTDNEL